MNQRLAIAGLAYSQSLLKSKLKPIPLFVNLFYTRRCNLRCSFCATIKRPAKKELTLKEWKKSADILYDLGNRFISITGGEPLVREDLPEFVNYLNQKPRLHSLITNGTLLNEKKLKALARAGLMHLGVSTQSLIPGKHVKSQNKDLFDLIAKYQQKYHFEVSALITLTNQNIKEIPEIVTFFAERKINVAPNLVTSGKDGWWFRSYCPDLQFKDGSLNDLRKTLDFLSRSSNVTYSKKYLENLYLYAKGGKPFDCQAGTYYFSINDDGFVMPCQDLPPTKIHFSKLPKNYPLQKPKCNDCMWPCYFEESYRRSHFSQFLTKSIRLVFNI